MNTLPNHPQAERNVLAAILREPRLLEFALNENLTAESFHTPDCKRIFAAMQSIHADGETADLVTLGIRLPGDMVAIAELEGSIATSANFDNWLKVLRRDEAARMLARSLQTWETALADNPPQVGTVIDAMPEIEGAARAMLEGKNVPTLEAAAEEVAARLTAEPVIVPIFPPRTEGAEAMQFHPSEMMIIGARTGSGKTAFACGAVLEQLRAGLTVAYFCTESTSADILSRIVAQACGVSHFRVTQNNRIAQEVAQFHAQLDEIRRRYAHRLFIHGCENGLITSDTVRATLRRVKQEAGRVDVAVIDFLQGVKAPAALAGRTALEQTNFAVTAIHDLLSDQRIAGLVLAQFSRQAGAKDAGLPKCEWLRDSSLIEQMAYTVAFLYRENKTDAVTKFYSDKVRNQLPFCLDLTWNGVGYVSKPRFAPGASATKGIYHAAH